MSQFSQIVDEIRSRAERERMILTLADKLAEIGDVEDRADAANAAADAAEKKLAEISTGIASTEQQLVDLRETVEVEKAEAEREHDETMAANRAEAEEVLAKARADADSILQAASNDVTEMRLAADATQNQLAQKAADMRNEVNDLDAQITAKNEELTAVSASIESMKDTAQKILG